MKIGVISLGCSKNLVDTENLLGMLRESKQEIVSSYDEAEAIIINTCGFIESAKEEAISTILDAARYKEKGLKKLIVMGCLTQRYKPQLEIEMPEVDKFISIDEYGSLGNILTGVLGEKIANHYGKAPRVLSGKPWMAYLRIADGCGNKCSYCAIPGIRGPLRSTPKDELIAEAKRLAKEGVKELNLVAQDSSRYGYDWDFKLHLSELLKELDDIDEFHWIRILYLYPDEIPDDLIDTIKNSKHILPYFDIPTQHGSDRMLKLMNRRGSHDIIVDRCNRIRATFARPTLRTTLIVGHPSETIEDHSESLRLLKECRWDHLGAFTYSKEEDTPSWDMEDDVPEAEKQRRKKEIMDLQKTIDEDDRRKLIGESDEILVEGRDFLTNMYIGRSSMQAPDGVDGVVRFRSENEYECGDFVKVMYTKVSGANMIAREITE